MKKCSDCNGKMEEKEATTPEGFRYHYYKCIECGEEIIDLKQLHEVADKYRALKLYHAKITQWGQSLGIRIPKQLATKYHFKPNKEVSIIPEKEGIKIILKD